MITQKNYHSETTRMSKSGLWKIYNGTPADYHHHYLSGEPKSVPSTPFRVGTALDVAVLTPENYIEDIQVVDRISKNLDWTLGKNYIRFEENEMVQKMKASIFNHYAARSILEDNVCFMQDIREFTEPETGINGKIAVDCAIPEKKWLVDLKSSDDASPKGFYWNAIKYGYDMQGAWYKDGYEAATGNEITSFIFIVVEKTAPYKVACYFMTPEMLQNGRQKYLQACKIYAECMVSGEWYGYSDSVMPLDKPY